MPSEEPGPYELARAIERNHIETTSDIAELRAHFTQSIDKVFNRLDSYVLVKVYDVELKALTDRIASIEERASTDRKFRAALLIALIAAIVGAVAATVGTVMTHGG